MPANCIVKGCRSIQKKGGPISFYRLPWKNVRLRNEWIRRAGYDPNNYDEVKHISRDHRVCSRHFWNNRKESPYDLPTFYLGNDPEKLKNRSVVKDRMEVYFVILYFDCEK
ncbi:uncharacterized protein LOC118762599 isoform X2 [Octopus sinensis]|uniref:Uncharacterized protein LOC118762599 isoform X2 n=1 Tax=Octopus sinensis TaxID=2607531 RepID=A0A7E6EQT7_9MOLL|nr:uncharacterized protein LOC118762599 isoform X2 [Octopus sinensis]